MRPCILMATFGDGWGWIAQLIISVQKRLLNRARQMLFIWCFFWNSSIFTPTKTLFHAEAVVLQCLWHNLFFHAFIDNLLMFSFTRWYNGLSVRDKNCFNNIVKVGSKMMEGVGHNLGWVLKKFISQQDQVLSEELSRMPSARCYNVPQRKTEVLGVHHFVCF